MLSLGFILLLMFGAPISCFRSYNTLSFRERPASRLFDLSNRILQNLKRKFANERIERVVKCWDDFRLQKVYQRYLDQNNEIHQVAECFIEGLETQPFYENSKFPWIPLLEARYKEIRDELLLYNKNKARSLKGAEEIGGEWNGARDVVGSSYGPQWKTLGLQDRNNWNDELIMDFPVTVRLVQEANVPSCEVFFARQGPKSGIQPHSDKNNFIITCHLPLDVPEGDCYITVGNHRHYWVNGRACVFDTSIVHSTENLSDLPRYILLLRLWHPDLTKSEINALRYVCMYLFAKENCFSCCSYSFLFRYLDSISLGDDYLVDFERKELFFGI